MAGAATSRLCQAAMQTPNIARRYKRVRARDLPKYEPILDGTQRKKEDA
jgi:hypothetical protein